MSQWYYAHDGKQSGPVPISELERLAGDGKFDPEKDLVWQEGLPDWKPASTVPELSSLMSGGANRETTAKEPAAEPGSAVESSPYESPRSPSAPSSPAPVAPVTGPPSVGLAVGSMVCGLISILSCCIWYLALPLGITAIVLGYKASSRIKSDPSRFAGKGFAQAGLIMGFIGSLLAVIAAVFSFWIITRTPEQLQDIDWLPPEVSERIQEELERQKANQEN